MTLEFDFDSLHPDIQLKIIDNINDGKAIAMMRSTCKNVRKCIDSQKTLVGLINQSADQQFKLWRDLAYEEGLKQEKENEETYLNHCKSIKPSYRHKQIALKIILGITTGVLAAGLLALVILVANLAMPLLGFTLATVPILAAILTFGGIKINNIINKRFSVYRFIPDETEKIQLVKLFVDDTFSSLCENKSLKKLLSQARKLGFIRPDTARFLKSLILKVETNRLGMIESHKQWETWKWNHKVIQQLPYLSRYFRHE